MFPVMMEGKAEGWRPNARMQASAWRSHQCGRRLGLCDQSRRFGFSIRRCTILLLPRGEGEIGRGGVLSSNLSPIQRFTGLGLSTVFIVVSFGLCLSQAHSR